MRVVLPLRYSKRNVSPFVKGRLGGISHKKSPLVPLFQMSRMKNQFFSGVIPACLWPESTSLFGSRSKTQRDDRLLKTWKLNRDDYVCLR